MNNVSNRVTVRGEVFHVVATRSTSDLGSKFYGRCVFTLRRLSDGATFTAYGKRVSHNSRLTAVAPSIVQ